MDVQAVFAENMKKYRKQAKLTQEKLAELCDTDHRYIGQIETGRRCPSLEYVERIASALNIAPYRLFYDDEEKTLFCGKGQTLQEQKQALEAALIEKVSQGIRMAVDELY